ncbi:MAG: hypothetical protein COW00_10930 [Bdellovibrio sp. CG12_big_fil_rev_8_21_14_0_65_39_13]|nr:MAG: hypothetical protein COW78_16285 [Bdellovibrio sp. CG22_combo_CG10-13_8_21_14_all_39_27]PIQ59236.1 MAG: hypothetical protein COW00_10930 [Bdellovibrio sp. CG12_big_fil_rev_8_21_14_0_65_39_13]PIR32247.1 MAG: hypothetical protein COV37_20220 [Bdellovibrio sp. CG11_big_fil_rev_8_21_14_0_20_39_38]
MKSLVLAISLLTCQLSFGQDNDAISSKLLELKASLKGHIGETLRDQDAPHFVLSDRDFHSANVGLGSNDIEEEILSLKSNQKRSYGNSLKLKMKNKKSNPALAKSHGSGNSHGNGKAKNK